MFYKATLLLLFITLWKPEMLPMFLQTNLDVVMAGAIAIALTPWIEHHFE